MAYKLGIIGHPLSHSLSNVMQLAALKSCNLEGTYDVLDTPSEDLISRIKMLKTQNYNGFNITIPHKVPITLFIEHCDDYANIIGAVNTIKVMDDKSFYGYNTDVYGFMKAIPEDFSLIGERAIIFGTGGACRAICAGLNELGVSEITLYTRNVVNSHKNAETLRAKFPEIKINLVQQELLKDFEDNKIVINATPLGMKSFVLDESPVRESVMETLRDDGLVYDIVYNPVKTKFIKQAEKFNKQYVTGVDMLVLQGARAFEIWTGKKPDIQKMKIAVLENLI